MKFLTVILISIAPGIVIYRFIIRRQFLQYDKSINGRLIVLGAVSIFFARICESILIFTSLSDYQKILFSSLIEQSMKIMILYFVVLRVKHYINKYDIVIYSVSIGIGGNVAATLFNAAVNGIFDSFVQAFSFSIIEVVYQIFIAFWVIKSIEARSHILKIASYITALIMPVIAQSLYGIMYMKDSSFLLFIEGGLEIFLYLIALYMLRKIAIENVKFDCVDEKKIYECSQMRKTLIQKISYKFDIVMSYGNFAVTLVLFLIGGILASLAALIIYINAPKQVNNSIFSAIWVSFMRVLDPGNVASDIASGNTIFVVATIFTTLAGLILMSSLIGIISSGFDKRLERLRSGNSKVLENGHILFLGFNEEVISMMNNLSNENKRKKKLKVVILSEKERKYVEDQIFENLINPLEFKVICRKGNAWDKEVLYNVSATTAEKIIILGDDDKLVIKSAVAVKKIMESNRCKVISTFAVIDSEENIYKAKKILGENIKIIFSQEIDTFPLERTLICKEYLSVYSDLTSVVREQIISAEYVKKAIGKKFGDLINNFWHSCPIGLVQDGKVLVNPHRDTLIKEHHKIIFIKGKNDIVKYGRSRKKIKHIETSIELDRNEKDIEKILIVGNTHIRERVVKILEGKSEITQYDDLDICGFENEIDQNAFQMIIILGNQGLSPEENDEEVLEKSFCIEAIKKEKKCSNSVVCYLNDEVNIEFAYEHNIAEYVITGDNYRLLSNEIIQENNLLRRIEKQLFDFNKGVDVIDVENLNIKGQMKVVDIFDRIYSCGMICIGYIIKDDHETRRIINPNLNDVIDLKDGDRIIVVR